VPSSAELDDALQRAAREIIAAARVIPRPVVLIDGRSGAGKTTLARTVASGLGAGVLSLDAFYPGWDGLSEGGRIAAEGVLAPLRAGRPGRWHRWDWERSRAAEAHDVDARTPWVIEGSGLLTPASRALSDVQVWVDAPEAVRKARALGRDGDAYRPHWERWAAQEEAHLREHRPDALASLLFRFP